MTDPASIFNNWWLVALKGVLVIFFGSLALAVPQVTMVALTFYFGILVLLAGVLIVAFALQNRTTVAHWKYFLAEGVIDLLFGLAVVVNPGLTLYFFIILLGCWLIFGGGFQIWFAIRHRAEMKGTNPSLINGVVTLALGAAIAFFPVSGMITLSWIIGFTALFFGSLLIVAALQMRKQSKQL
ncbi:MAG: hypothetical protein DA408_20335 [Bacteroidetes bacterium]|nr:MAG: hypothetical protein DA408_20335 [Bacteroidota bacterium]